MVFNSIKMHYWNNVKLELDISKGLFVLGLISFGLYFLAKDWQNGLTKIMIGTFGICLMLNLYTLSEYYKIMQIQNTIAEYSKIETCDEMEKRFATDLKKGKIKYFQFGIATDIELQKSLKTKYGIESYGMGCIVQSKMDCYNDLVNDYLKEKYNDKIVDY